MPVQAVRRWKPANIKLYRWITPMVVTLPECLQACNESPSPTRLIDYLECVAPLLLLMYVPVVAGEGSSGGKSKRACCVAIGSWICMVLLSRSKSHDTARGSTSCRSWHAEANCIPEIPSYRWHDSGYQLMRLGPRLAAASELANSVGALFTLFPYRAFCSTL